VPSSADNDFIIISMMGHHPADNDFIIVTIVVPSSG
jgi:hypothetical protein